MEQGRFTVQPFQLVSPYTDVEAEEKAAEVCVGRCGVWVYANAHVCVCMGAHTVQAQCACGTDVCYVQMHRA